MKAQTSVEFLLLVAFGTLIFVVFFGVIQDRILATNNEQLNHDLDRLNKLISSEINLASRFSDGYQRDFWLPTSLRGLKYNASIKDNSTLLLQAGGSTNLYFFDFPIYGELHPGDNSLISVFNAVYLNMNLSEVFTIRIDGNDDDWQALQQWYGITPLFDNPDDEYYVQGTPFFGWDLKNLLIWNDDENLYFRIELYSNTIRDFEKIGANNVVDFMILLDTEAGGYSDNDPDEVIVDFGVDYLVSDKYLGLGNTLITVLYDGYSPDLPLRHDPLQPPDAFSFVPTTGATPVLFDFIDDYTMELSVPLSRMGLDPANEDTIRFVVVARDNQTKSIDYLPGIFDDFSGGVYNIQNR